MKLYEALTAHRKLIKMSFNELAERSGIPVSTLQKVFTGVTANPPFETVRSIAYAMGITTDDLTNAMKERGGALSPAALSVAQKYDLLTAHGQKVVSAVIDLELEHSAQDAELSNRLEAAISRRLPDAASGK